MRREPKAIIEIDNMSAGRRPTLSVNLPRTTPPSGRKKNPTAKVAKVAMRDVSVSPVGKNSAAM